MRMHYRKIGIALGTITSLLIAPFFVLADHSTTTTVSPDNLNDWWTFEEVATGTIAFTTGPDTPPLGDGSAQLTVNDTGRALLGTFIFQGTRLDSITSLSYESYRATGTSALAPSLQLDIDTDLTDATTTWQGRLVYEPYYTHTVETEMWQEWDTQDDAPDGNWWFSGAPGNTVCPIGDPCTWSEVLSAFPDAGIRLAGTSTGALQFKAGGPWTDGFEGYVDNLELTVDGHVYTFDFEAEETVIPPTGSILAPTDNQTVSGTTTLSATYDDGDELNDDDVNWAVRKSTCDVATSTVFGNVDGFTDPYDWDGASFEAIIDTNQTEPGPYCFIFNPTDDGDTDIRLLRDFIIEAPATGTPDTVDLEISKTASIATTTIDTEFTYTIHVTNNGPDTATSVVVTDIIPSELDIVDIVSTDGDYSTTTHMWSIGELANGSSTILTLTVEADSLGEIVNTATVTNEGGTPDSNLDNNSDSVTVTIVNEEEEDDDDDDDPEPPTEDKPHTKDDCKNGGWMNYPDLGFKNQGHCVSYVASGKKSYEARANRVPDSFEKLKGIYAKLNALRHR